MSLTNLAVHLVEFSDLVDHVCHSNTHVDLVILVGLNTQPVFHIAVKRIITVNLIAALLVVHAVHAVLVIPAVLVDLVTRLYHPVILVDRIAVLVGLMDLVPLVDHALPAVTTDVVPTLAPLPTVTAVVIPVVIGDVLPVMDHMAVGVKYH